MAKTLYKPTRPKAIDKVIKSYTKLNLPHFFKYAKNKEDNKVCGVNDSPMNMLDRIIPKSTLRVNKTISRIDTKILLSDKHFKLTDESEIVVKCYDYWNINQYFINYFNREEDSEEDFRVEQDIYLYQKIREKILKLPYDKDFIVNSLVKFLYVKRKSSHKKLLWACFGEEIYNNIQTNTQSLGKICPICGKRFEPKGNQNCCSEYCIKINEKEKTKERVNRFRE